MLNSVLQELVYGLFRVLRHRPTKWFFASTATSLGLALAQVLAPESRTIGIVLALAIFTAVLSATVMLWRWLLR